MDDELASVLAELLENPPPYLLRAHGTDDATEQYKNISYLGAWRRHPIRGEYAPHYVWYAFDKTDDTPYICHMLSSTDRCGRRKVGDDTINRSSESHEEMFLWGEARAKLVGLI